MSKMEWPRAWSHDLEVTRPREIGKLLRFPLEYPRFDEAVGVLIISGAAGKLVLVAVNRV